MSGRSSYFWLERLKPAEAVFDETYPFSPLLIPQRSVRKPKLTPLAASADITPAEAEANYYRQLAKQAESTACT